MHQDLAVGTDQEGVAHAVEVAGAEGVDQGLQAEVAADHADVLPGFFRGGGDGDDGLASGRIDIRFGQGRCAAAFGAFVPRAHPRVETGGHSGVRTNGEAAGGVAQVRRHEGRRQGFLLKQAGDGGRFRIDRDVLG
ncbi:hypothetical protein D3C87_1486720 [compost metagenome]